MARTLATRYAAAGHDVRVATMAWRDLATVERSASGVVVQRLACGRRRREQAGGVTALVWAARALRWAKREHRERPFDVVHAHFVMPGGLVAWRLRSLGVPYVLTAHGSDVPGFDPSRFRWAHRVVAPWWRLVCERAAALVTPSRALERLMRAAAPALSIERIPNPIDHTAFEAAPKDSSLLLCGRLVERKGIAGFLEALRELELPGWRIDVVGDGPERDRVAGAARSLRVEVRLHGWIEQGDRRLRELFSQAAIFVFPSLRENLPVVLLEAMAAGCAIVATDLPGNVEAVGDAARLVAVGDPVALREAVVELVAQPQMRRTLGAAARRRAVEEFGAEVVAARYLERLGPARLATGA